MSVMLINGLSLNYFVKPLQGALRGLMAGKKKEAEGKLGACKYDRSRVQMGGKHNVGDILG